MLDIRVCKASRDQRNRVKRRSHHVRIDISQHTYFFDVKFSTVWPPKVKVPHNQTFYTKNIDIFWQGIQKFTGRTH